MEEADQRGSITMVFIEFKSNVGRSIFGIEWCERCRGQQQSWLKMSTENITYHSCIHVTVAPSPRRGGYVYFVHDLKVDSFCFQTYAKGSHGHGSIFVASLIFSFSFVLERMKSQVTAVSLVRVSLILVDRHSLRSSARISIIYMFRWCNVSRSFDVTIGSGGREELNKRWTFITANQFNQSIE